MSTVQPTYQPHFFVRPLIECKEEILSIWNSIRSLESIASDCKQAIQRTWTVLKQAAQRFPLIAFVAFRALQLVIPMIALGLEVCYLYLKSTYESYSKVKTEQANALLIERVAFLEKELSHRSETAEEIKKLTDELKEQLKQSEITAKRAQIDHTLLSAKNLHLEKETTTLSDQLAKLTEEHNRLRTEHAATKIPAPLVDYGNYSKLLTELLTLIQKHPDKDVVIATQIFFEKIIPTEMEGLVQNKNILQTELEHFPEGQDMARNALARVCKILDRSIANWKVLHTFAPKGAH